MHGQVHRARLAARPLGQTDQPLQHLPRHVRVRPPGQPLLDLLPDRHHRRLNRPSDQTLPQRTSHHVQRIPPHDPIYPAPSAMPSHDYQAEGVQHLYAALGARGGGDYLLKSLTAAAAARWARLLLALTLVPEARVEY